MRAASVDAVKSLKIAPTSSESPHTLSINGSTIHARSTSTSPCFPDRSHRDESRDPPRTRFINSHCGCFVESLSHGANRLSTRSRRDGAPSFDGSHRNEPGKSGRSSSFCRAICFEW